jgi:eukaryotic-like serine/threonine-protein kinase
MTAIEPDWQRAQIGRVLGGRWTLLALLGTGGSAAVYEASHRNGKHVAIKLLRPQRGLDARQRRRFLREGYVANQIGHHAVVGIDDDGEEPDGTAYLVMERLEGETLEQLAARSGGRVPWPKTVELCCQLLEVLVHAHQRGIVHRDIKPGNLFLSVGGELRVLDFGLARSFEPVAGDASVTGEGTVLGTPAFMAPEQARASLDAVGPWSDLWAVGATAFTLLTGRRVYEAPTLEDQLALAAVASAPRLTELAPGVPEAITQVLQRALEYEPAARWPSAEAMLEALRRAVPKDGQAQPGSGEVSAVELRRWRMRPVHLAAVVLLAVSALAFGVLRFSSPTSPAASNRGAGAPSPLSSENAATPSENIAPLAAPSPGARAAPASNPAAPPRSTSSTPLRPFSYTKPAVRAPAEPPIAPAARSTAAPALSADLIDEPPF